MKSTLCYWKKTTLAGGYCHSKKTQCKEQWEWKKERTLPLWNAEWVNLGFLASSSVTTHCSHLYSYLGLRKMLWMLSCVYQPACVVQLNIYCLQFGDVSFTWFSFCKGAHLGLSFPPNYRYLWNFIFLLTRIFPSRFLENEQGVQKFGGDEKGTDRQMDRRCHRINLRSIGNQAIWKLMKK